MIRNLASTSTTWIFAGRPDSRACVSAPGPCRLFMQAVERPSPLPGWRPWSGTRASGTNHDARLGSIATCTSVRAAPWNGTGAGRGPQQLLRLAAMAAQPRPKGPGERQPSRLSTRPCLNGTAASTAHHASIKSSGPLASSWAAIAMAPHALFSAQGQDQTRVQALSEHRQPGQWCGREPAAAEVQPHRGWFAFRRRRLKKFPIKVCKTSKA